MKNYTFIMLLFLTSIACNNSSNSNEQIELKEQIEVIDSVNTEMDNAQKELEESMDAIDDIINTL